MYVIEVIPLTLLPPNVPQILSYFFDRKLQKGAIVEIPLNKRKIKAVVISSNSLEKEKLSLKKVDFQIKKLTKVIYDNPQISDYQLKIAVWIAKYYYSPLGYTLKTILPPFAFKKKYPALQRADAFSDKNHSLSDGAGPAKKQLLIYKTRGLAHRLEPIIKEVVSKSKQVLIMVPEKTSINYFVSGLSKKLKTSVVFSGLSNKEFYDAWQKAQSGEANIIIGTRQALNMPFKDLGLIIVDDPLHEFYKSDMVPRYNAVTLAHKIAELNNSQLILTSVVPGIENLYKTKRGVYKLKNIESRPKFDAEIIDMAQEAKNANWSPISKKLNEELLAYLKAKKRVLIFSPRRGYAGILICENCGSAAKCPRCEVAMRTHRSVEMILVCHRCALSKPMPKNCSVCGNYNLKTVGPAGTQKIYDIIKMTLNAVGIKSPILALDTDIAKNEVEEEEIISEILKSRPAVLIATQMVFSHRFCLNFDLIAIVNADALTNMPDFKSEENLFYQIEKLVNFLPARAFGSGRWQAGEPGKMLIQTYNPENKLIKKAVMGDYIDFYDKELKFRQILNYPPFFKLIKLTLRHTDKNKASYAAKIATEKFKIAVTRAKLEETVKLIEAAPAYIEREKGLYVYNIFLKVREDYQDINKLLKYAGPGWIVDVEPRSLL
ncbi:MAG: primosomal protein N' [Candidatus Yanofskybacteria bacterium RIFCSPHIGHO2_01_FULL_43_42]|uniref:Replication restart protein PriA n=1 Tax=Candidatus Yanofskybacteria bacterium RIFCSPLOWO2_01_FULL_43_22 TaxID=1802695 RepID=A0A1F8GD46_9BACT|nr:MAG: primosomal protein N' [Candidatus Yanofskybacteria bacterium RIFCSPHIGHO2_01_FULL_43_42]OGN12670.1 MAG: primosomal protein N' [Candidatus Yanofskybacteria bacterium RIFCSPHIGHO2_02_FULL_43_17]OGN23294.1 MAG: primosomal protein N' [Candidatus Yanofskybacteria bacterium RIFCSPLOWO2_01_FULL_43_22]